MKCKKDSGTMYPSYDKRGFINTETILEKGKEVEEVVIHFQCDCCDYYEKILFVKKKVIEKNE